MELTTSSSTCAPNTIFALFSPHLRTLQTSDCSSPNKDHCGRKEQHSKRWYPNRISNFSGALTPLSNPFPLPMSSFSFSSHLFQVSSSLLSSNGHLHSTFSQLYSYSDSYFPEEVEATFNSLSPNLQITLELHQLSIHISLIVSEDLALILQSFHPCSASPSHLLHYLT